MSAPASLAVVLGLALGTGLWLAVSGLPAMRRVSFAERIAVQLRAARADSRLLSPPGREAPFGPLGRILAPVLADLVAWTNRINPLGEALDKRLRKAGLDMSPADFRASQLLWGAVAFLVTGLCMVGSAVSGSLNPWLGALVLGVSAVCGFVLREWYLGEQVQRRSRRILGQFPTIADLLALSVAAGESTLGAIERVSRTACGDLADEFTVALAEVRAGAPLAEALRGLANRTEVTALSRFVDALIVAAERGTPLAQVLRDQAQDVRDASKRELMETAGKKEIGMMAPVVFGVLPLSVLFAVYPGLALINLEF